MDIGEIITTLATALATVIMAVFTFLTYRLNQRQSKIYEESHSFYDDIGGTGHTSGKRRF